MKVEDDAFIIKRVDSNDFQLAVYLCGLPEDIRVLQEKLESEDSE